MKKNYADEILFAHMNEDVRLEINRDQCTAWLCATDSDVPRRWFPQRPVPITEQTR